MNQVQPMDWSATAAWIALAISIIGTIASPLITTILTNRHQRSLRELEIKQRATEQYDERRFLAINTFISMSGKCLSHPNNDNVREFGACFHNIYPYVSRELWTTLDDLYSAVTSNNWGHARELHPNIIHELAGILKEIPQ